MGNSNNKFTELKNQLVEERQQEYKIEQAIKKMVDEKTRQSEIYKEIEGHFIKCITNLYGAKKDHIDLPSGMCGTRYIDNDCWGGYFKDTFRPCSHISLSSDTLCKEALAIFAEDIRTDKLSTRCDGDSMNFSFR